MASSPTAPESDDLLPTVVLEHARTGQPLVVNLDDYLAEKDGRFANWRLLGHGDFIAPPPLPSERSAEQQAPPPPPRPERPRRRRRGQRRRKP